MLEREELERSLALARQALQGPAAMKARVRAQLVASGASAPARLHGALPSGAPEVTANAKASLAPLRRLCARRPHLGTVAVLIGLGFGAGFWLGRQPSDRLVQGAVGSPSGATLAEPPALSTTPEAVTLAPLRPGGGSATRDAAALVGALAPEQRASADVPVDPLASASRAASRAPGAIEPTSRRALSKPASSKSATLTRARDNAASALRDDQALMLEVSLLQRADRAIRAGEGALALGLLDELGRQVHAPRLRQEAAAARVLARCVRSGARSKGSLEEHEARAGAERFLAESAASVYAERIRSACPLEAKAAGQRTSSEEPNAAGH